MDTLDKLGKRTKKTISSLVKKKDKQKKCYEGVKECYARL